MCNWALIKSGLYFLHLKEHKLIHEKDFYFVLQWQEFAGISLVAQAHPSIAVLYGIPTRRFPQLLQNIFFFGLYSSNNYVNMYSGMHREIGLRKFKNKWPKYRFSLSTSALEFENRKTSHINLIHLPIHGRIQIVIELFPQFLTLCREPAFVFLSIFWVVVGDCLYRKGWNGIKYIESNCIYFFLLLYNYFCHLWSKKKKRSFASLWTSVIKGAKRHQLPGEARPLARGYHVSLPGSRCEARWSYAWLFSFFLFKD